MERGFEQLYVVAAILLIAILDLFARWRRGKTRSDQPAGDSGVEDVVVQDAQEADVAVLEQWPVEDQAPPPAPPPRPVPRRPPLPVRPPVPELEALPSAAPRVAPMRRHRARRWLWQPVDVRRGIVLMEILGPCRGLEPPYRDG